VLLLGFATGANDPDNVSEEDVFYRLVEGLNLIQEKPMSLRWLNAAGDEPIASLKQVVREGILHCEQRLCLYRHHSYESTTIYLALLRRGQTVVNTGELSFLA